MNPLPLSYVDAFFLSLGFARPLELAAFHGGIQLYYEVLYLGYGDTSPYSVSQQANELT